LIFLAGSAGRQGALTLVDAGSRRGRGRPRRADSTCRRQRSQAFCCGDDASRSSRRGRQLCSLASLVPLILILMTVTGAVYPAIDLTAGERERGTLEILVAAPGAAFFPC